MRLRKRFAKNKIQPTTASFIKNNYFLENVLDVIWVMDLNMRIVNVSQSCENMYGYTQNEMMGIGLDRLVSSDQLEEIKELFMKSMEFEHKGSKTPPIIIEMKHLKKDGSVFFVELSASIARDINGNPQAVVGVTRDINERKNIESELSRHISLESTLSQIARMMISPGKIDYKEIIEIIGREVGANRVSIFQFSGKEFSLSKKYEWYDESTFSTMHLFEDFHIEDKLSISKLASGEPVIIDDSDQLIGAEKAICKKAGVTSAVVVPIHSEMGELEGLITFVYNKKPKDLKTMVDVLFTFSEMVSKDIARKKAIEIEKERSSKADQAARMEAISDLAAGIAHDFNNLLAGIVGNITLAKMALENHFQNSDPVASEINQTLNEALEASSNATNLTRQLQDLSKREMGNSKIQIINVLNMVNNMVKWSLKGSNITYDIQADQGLWNIIADKKQIEQHVLLNILVNARQAMNDSGAIVISINNETATNNPNLKPGEYVKISISDNGPGIKPEIIPKIFDLYFTTKKGTGGSGLGLASAYNATKRFGGHINVNSVFGKGATFEIYLPATNDKYSKESTRPPKQGFGKILWMDDESYIRSVAKRLTERLGYDTITVIDGESMLSEYLKELNNGTPYDLVFLDATIQNGGMGGLEAVKFLIDIDPKAKAVLCSGHLPSIAINGIIDNSFVAALQKPFSLNDLSNTIQTLLNNK